MLASPSRVALCLFVAFAGCGDEGVTPKPDVSPDSNDAVSDVSESSDSAEPEDAPEEAGEVETVEVDGAADSTSEPIDTEVIDIEPAPTCGDGVRDPDEACDDGDLDDLDGCDRHCAITHTMRPPAVGELVITEVMINPSAVPAPHGEWIELTSLASEALNLSGCALIDDGTDRVDLALDGGRTVLPNALVLVAGEANLGTGLAPDLVMTTMLLDDRADEVVLVCDGLIIDRVAWTPFAWPVISGRALALDPSRRDADANDAVDSWCAATTRYGPGDRGTPGTANPSCPHLDRTVDRCRLLGDPTVSGFADAPIALEVEVEELGITDLTPGVDPSPDLLVELGSTATTQTDPAAYTWARTTPKPAYQAPLGSRADVWRGEVTAPVGTRRAMARASRDGGASWLYCDRDGSDNGVSLDQLTTLTFAQSPCAAVTCAAPPAAICAADGVHLLGFSDVGQCHPVDATTHTCDYPATALDCGALGRICEPHGQPGAICGAVPRTPIIGDLTVSELMVRPTAPDGQWIELRSYAPDALLLTGCTLTLEDATTTPNWVIEAPTVIAANGFIVLGRTDAFDTNGGAPVDRSWGEALGEAGLPNVGALTLSCGEILDSVRWDTTWPGVTGLAGASASLSPLRTAPADNDTKDGWCRASASYGGGDRGTPGALNLSCPGDIVPVDGCHLAPTLAITLPTGPATLGPSPAALAPPAGTQATALVHVIATAWTARTLRTDPNAKLIVELGVAPRGATASAITTWSPTTPDATWTASGAGVDPAEDRYIAPFAVPAPGVWDLYARATADGGNTWVTCDGAKIIAPDAVGAPLAIAPTSSACAPNPCATVPAPYCRPVASGSPTEVIAALGPAVCTLTTSGAACSYLEALAEDCAEYGAVCGDITNEGARCTGFPRTPMPGEMVVAELMIAPSTQELGEWIELQNTTDDALDLTTCGLRSGPAESWDFPAPPGPLVYVVPANEAVTLARSGTSSINGNAQPIMVWSDLALANDADFIELVCDGLSIDRVAWDATWTIPRGASLQLSGAALDARSNDSAANYCAPPVTSPRVPNRVCPADGVLDDCRVVIANTAVVADGLSAVSVLAFDRGVTDKRPFSDPAMGMSVEVGLGPATESPLTSFAWHWTELEPDDAWDDRLTGPAGWDRWVGAIAAGAVGNLRLLGRISLDHERTWTLCGTSGITTTATGGPTITSRAGLCAPSPCTTPPAATCSGATLTGYAPRGDCTSTTTASCTYPSETFSCASYGGCSASTSSCQAPPQKPSIIGSLVISEVMRDSTLPAPDLGEWIEIYNAGTVPLDLRGCELVDGDGARTTLTRGVPDVILANSHAVFAHTADTATNGGIPTFIAKPRDLGPLTLGNGADSVALVCNNIEIDRVAWSFGWPGQTGVAMQLDRLHLNASDNDLRAHWCASAPAYGNAGNRGSPGSLNSTCL